MATFTSNFLSFIENSMARKIWLLEIDMYDPGDSSTTTYYYSSEPYFNGTVHYEPRIKVPLETSRAIYSGTKMGGQSVPTFGDLVLVNVDEGLDFIFEDGLAADGRSVKVKLGGTSLTYAQFGTVFEGTAQGVYHSQNGQEVIVKLRSNEFDVASRILQSATYMGIGQCLEFTRASSTVVTIPDAAVLESTTALTVEALVWIPSGATTGQNQGIVHKGPLSGVTGSVSLAIVSTDFFRFGIADGATFVGATSTTTPAAGAERWVRVTGVWDGTDVKIYIDGVEEDSTPDSSVVPQDIAYVWTVGASTNTGAGGIDARICDVRIWPNVARTGEEIRDTMHRELDEGEWSDPSAYLRFNEGTGTSAADDSGNSNHGTLVNSPTWESTYEGSADLVGKPKPICFGRVQTMRPVYIDRIKNLYQVHYTGVAGVDEVWAGGAQLIPDFSLTATFQMSATSPYPDWGMIEVSDDNWSPKALKPGQLITISAGTNAGDWTVTGAGLDRLYVDKDRVDTTGTFSSTVSPGVTISTKSGTEEFFTDELQYGCIRLANLADEPLQAAVRGYRTTLDMDDRWGGTNYLPDPITTADIVKEILTVFGGVEGSEIDSTSFSALNTANSKGIGFVLGTEFVTVGEVIDKLLTAVGAFWGYARNGNKLTLGQIVEPTGTADLELTEVEIIDIAKISSVQAIKGLKASIVRNFDPLGIEDIVGVILESTNITIEQLIVWLTNRTFDVSPVEDPDVITLHPTAIDGEPLEMFFSNRLPTDYWANAGRVEAKRQFALYKEDRDFFRVTVKSVGYSVELGDIVQITLDEFGLGAGQKFMIVSTKEDGASNRVELVVWG